MFFLGAVLVLILNSCVDNQNLHFLKKAEECFYTHPDSTQFFLDVIDFPEKMNEKNQARWAFLSVRSHQKNDVSLRNDTLILQALAYYTDQNDVHNIGKANLYAGRVFEAREDFSAAKKYFDEAIKIGMFSGNYKLAGRSASELGEIFQEEHQYELAIKWFTNSYEWAKNANDIYYQINALRKRADCFVELDQMQRALRDYQDALDQIPVAVDDLRSDIYKNRALTYLKMREYTKAEDDIKKAMSYDENGKLKGIQFLILADIFDKNNQTDSAKWYYYKAFMAAKNNRDFAVIDAAFESVTEKEGINKPFNSNLGSYHRYKSTSDSIFEKEKFNSTVTFENKFHQERIKSNNKTLVIRNQNYLIVLFITCLAILFLFYKFHVKTLKDRAMLLEMNKLIQHRDRTIKIYEISSSKLLEIYRKMVLLARAPQAHKYAKLLADYNQIVHNSDADLEFDWGVFEELLDSVYPNFKAKITQGFPELQVKEIDMILLQKGGFTFQEIADLLNLSIHTIYRRNSGIRKKVDIPESKSMTSFLNEVVDRT